MKALPDPPATVGGTDLICTHGAASTQSLRKLVLIVWHGSTNSWHSPDHDETLVGSTDPFLHSISAQVPANAIVSYILRPYRYVPTDDVSSLM